MKKKLNFRSNGAMNKLLALMMALTFLTAAGAARADEKEGRLLLEENRRILFLGDSITWNGRFITFFDAWLTARYPDRQYEVINCGLPSETVSGLSEEGHAGGKFPRPCLSERLDRVLEAVKPDLIIACYGMNCGIYLPFDESRFAKYCEGIEKLRDAARAAGAEIVFMTPPVFDHTKAPWADATYNDVLGKYGAWLLSKRSEGWPVIDLHDPMAAALKEKRAANPDFAFQKDGVHPGDEGHWFMASRIIRFFGDEEAASAASAEAMLKDRADILPPIQQRMELLRNAWLSHTGHKRPGLPEGLPLKKAVKKAAAMSVDSIPAK